MITMHARPRQTDRQTNIMTIARRFVLALETKLLISRYLEMVFGNKWR